MAPTTICLATRKGGVGRTTLCVNLAGSYAKLGARVLCLDLDGQASLSRTFFGSTEVERLRPEQTVAALFADDNCDLIRPTRFDRISVVPSGSAIEQFASARSDDCERDQHIVPNYLESLGEQYDLVLIDTPPQMNISTVFSALAASHHVLSPTPADPFGVQAISNLLDLVAAVQSRANPGLQVIGYVISMIQRNSVNDAYRRMLRKLHGSQVLDTEIPLAAAIKEAITERSPISHFKPRNKTAKIIDQLAEEIRIRVQADSKRKVA